MSLDNVKILINIWIRKDNNLITGVINVFVFGFQQVPDDFCGERPVEGDEPLFEFVEEWLFMGEAVPYFVRGAKRDPFVTWHKMDAIDNLDIMPVRNIADGGNMMYELVIRDVDLDDVDGMVVKKLFKRLIVIRLRIWQSELYMIR